MGYSIKTGLLEHGECAAEPASESPLWRKLVASFTPGVLYLFDLGFFERKLFAAAQDARAHVLMRLKKTAKVRVIGSSVDRSMGEIAAIISLLTRMRDLNQELVRQLDWKNRKRPASETTHRLQLELPFVVLATPEPPANDTLSGSDEDDPDGEKPKRKKRKKPDQANRDAHGRPKFPEHIPRVEGDVELVTGDARICPHCAAECEHVTFKVCQKLDIEPARYVVREDKREVVACQHCHGHAATAPKRDEVLDRGVLHAPGGRGLVGALRRGDHRAVKGLGVDAKLFHVDAESKRAGESIHQRLARRKRDSAPLIAEQKAWVETAVGDAEPKSDLGKALRYIQRQWPRLTRFLDDPLMELTNNEVERDLRTWVLSRKTWLFCGHDASAQRAADALTIITTCKKLGHDARCYRDTLKRTLDGEKELNALLPENYKPGGVLGSTLESSAAA
ncbi:MAG: transposase [Polyangiaceae bacterium]